VVYGCSSRLHIYYEQMFFKDAVRMLQWYSWMFFKVSINAKGGDCWHIYYGKIEGRVFVFH
jgi:hypothetical protein